MRILHIVASIQASTGGPAVSVTRLASEQAKAGNDVTLACLDYPWLGPQIATPPGVRVVSMRGGFCTEKGRGWCPKFRRVIMDLAASADIVHNHGLWMWPNAYARKAAVAAKKPLVISPRGMLESWSLRRSRFRKALAWRLFERKNLQAAVFFHATAESEAVSIKKLGLTQSVVISPNGVDLLNLNERPGRELIEEKFPQLRNKRWVVFMSRLHPKKGIDVLLRAWEEGERLKEEKTKRLKDQGTKRLKDEEAEGGVLVLAGPDLIGYRAKVERMIREQGLGDSVILIGEVQGREKEALLGNAEVFVLPSYSENFGIVVAEALAWGLPVITTTGTPWEEIEKIGAGWWVEPKEEALRGALNDVLGKSKDELREMGKRGRHLIEEKYGWREAAEKVIRGYEKILIQGKSG